MIFNSAATACLALASAILPASLVSGDEGQQSAVRVKTKRADDKVQIHSAGDKTTVSIRSPYGISRAEIERSGDQWPACIVLKLHLKGLEHLRLTNGKSTLEASVATQEGKPAIRLWKDKAEDTPLDRNSPYWINVRTLGDDGKPTSAIPLKETTFELTLPPAFFDGNPQSITASWIDFYRG